jgi:hypothetical protein
VASNQLAAQAVAKRKNRGIFLSHGYWPVTFSDDQAAAISTIFRGVAYYGLLRKITTQQYRMAVFMPSSLGCDIFTNIYGAA